jgi:hypothetical protein
MTRSTQTPDSPDTPELALSLDTIARVVLLAREFDGKVGSSDPDADPVDDDDVDAAVIEDRPSDPVRQELAAILSDLDVDAQIDLVALMWLGRDDLTIDDWEDTRATATEEHSDHTTRYLMGTPLLADHIEAGLDALGLDLDEEGDLTD